MPTDLVLKLLKKYGECPQCGNTKLGNGKGKLDISDCIFERTCECGCEINIKVNKSK